MAAMEFMAGPNLEEGQSKRFADAFARLAFCEGIKGFASCISESAAAVRVQRRH